LNFFRLLFIEGLQFGARLAVCPQELIEFRLRCLHITMLGALNEQRHE